MEVDISSMRKFSKRLCSSLVFVVLVAACSTPSGNEPGTANARGASLKNRTNQAPPTAVAYRASPGTSPDAEPIRRRSDDAEIYFHIVKQPQSLTKSVSSPAEFEVLVNNGGTPVTYQWQLNDGREGSEFIDIPSATNAVYRIPHVQFENVASYRVIVRSGGMERVSDMAHLSVYNLSEEVSAPKGIF